LSHTSSETNPKVPKRTARGSFKRNWRLYIFEAIELAIFMISACASTVFLFDPAYPMPHILPNAAFRRVLMGIAMGITAIFIIRSPMGKRSGAHFNPAITLTYFRLGKIDAWNAFFYVVFQFLGGVFGVAVSALLLGKSLADPTVNYAVTVPGRYGTAAAFYDAIIIGTGAGGGTLALHLAQAGKKILILERGPFMPQEKLNWDTSAVFLDNRYHTKEIWQDKNGKDLHPQQSYFVGGQTKVFGAAMFRMRAEDFGVIQHQGGISPAWPISYADMEPFYTRAEELFHVHGDLGSAPAVPGGYRSSFDPTEPFHSKKYPFPALANEPRMQSIEDSVRKLGIHTFPIPLGLKRDESSPLKSKCVRCDTCDGYPCLVHAKSDADINCIRQILHLPNVTLMTTLKSRASSHERERHGRDCRRGNSFGLRRTRLRL
jgi:glycerol uptake facilitator-like aquaporin